MNKSTKHASSIVQEDEIASINAHLDYVNKLFKWSIHDLEEFIEFLKSRLSAEETYMQSLKKITKLVSSHDADQCPYFGHFETSFHHATLEYEKSIEKTITLRSEFIVKIRSQIELLIKFRDNLEQRKKKVKQVVGDKNSTYSTYRTRDILKLRKAYMSKCNDLVQTQKQLPTFQPSQQHPASLSTQSLDAEIEPSIRHSIPLNRISSEEPQPRISSDSGKDTDASSISSANLQEITFKKGMVGFMASMRTQITHATVVSNVDPSKQTARFAKLKKEISDTDLEYRKGIRQLESLRKMQVETANHAMTHVGAAFSDKAEVTRTVLTNLLDIETSTLFNEATILQTIMPAVDCIEGKKDVELLTFEYEKKGFSSPTTLLYENFQSGECKDILFGGSLKEYSIEHRRTVPLLVVKCISAIERMGGLQKEGIYRISGRQMNVDMLKCDFEKDEAALELDSNKYDVFAISSVLKIYLRELSEPLFNLSIQERVDYSNVDETQRYKMLQEMLKNLLQPHRCTLRMIVQHLAKVNSYSQVNKMNLQNLSYIFTPSIFQDHNQAENAGEWYSDKVLQDLILYYDTLFPENEEELIVLPTKASTLRLSTSSICDQPYRSQPSATDSAKILISSSTSDLSQPNAPGEPSVRQDPQMLVRNPNETIPAGVIASSMSGLKNSAQNSNQLTAFDAHHSHPSPFNTMSDPPVSGRVAQGVISPQPISQSLSDSPLTRPGPQPVASAASQSDTSIQTGFNPRAPGTETFTSVPPIPPTHQQTAVPVQEPTKSKAPGIFRRATLRARSVIPPLHGKHQSTSSAPPKATITHDSPPPLTSGSHNANTYNAK
ncbi:hypothetical protein CLU79DRAFT_811007 [Phycomyces nitens]|nr:hypothetical protein CLU79DRAFT_811007 [Phycomyces nitens]